MRPLWIEVRHPQTRKLLFRYDPVHEVIEVKPQKTRVPVLIDLYIVKATYAAQIETILTGATGDPDRPERHGETGKCLEHK